MIEVIKHERKHQSLTIFARRVLVHGLLCSKDSRKWLIAGMENSAEIVIWLEIKYKQHEKMFISDICIGYINPQNWIDYIVIGVDSKENLFSKLRSISMPFLSKAALDDLKTSWLFVNSKALNPANWKTNV